MSVEVDLKRLYVLHRTKVGFAVFGREVVVVVRYVAHELDVPTLVGRIRKISLVVDERRLILALGVHRTQQILRRLVAQAVAPRELLVAHAHESACSEHTCRGRRFETLRTAVFDVER